MAVNLSPYGGVGAQFLDNSGNVLTGGKIFTYAAGTTTNQATYTNATGAIPHSNPIILDAAGRVPGGEIWLTDGLQYKFVLKDSNDVLIATYDNVIGINSNFVNYATQVEIQTATAGQTVFTLTTINYTPGTNSLSVFVDGVNQYDGVSYSYVETNSTTVTFTSGLHVGALVKFTTAVTLSSGVTTADLVSYDPPFTNSVPTTVEDKLAQTISVKDFGAAGDGVTDDTAAIQAAIDYASKILTSTQYPTDVYGVEIQLDSGVYAISNTLSIVASGVSLIGEGQYSTIIKYIPGSLTTNDYLIEVGVLPADDTTAVRNNRLENFSLAHDQPSAGLNSPRGIRLVEAHSWIVQNIRIFGTHQAFYAERSYVGVLSDSFFAHNYRGSYFNGACHNTSVRNVGFGRTITGYADLAVKAHFTVRNSWAVEIKACDFEFGDFANLDSCVYLFNSCRGIDVSTNYFENNTGYALYIRDESSGNNTECSGITFNSNFVNQSTGKGIFVRHNNTVTGALHEGILIEGNYVFIDPAVNFIENSTDGVRDSYYRGNYIAQGLAEAQRPNDWNQYQVRSVTATGRCFTPSQIVNANNLSLGVHSYDYLNFQAPPLSLTTTVPLQGKSVYLVTVVLETGVNSHETAVYIASVLGTSTQLTPINAVTQGTVAIVLSSGSYYIEYSKSGGFSTAVRIVAIPLSGRD
jgi:hypothetical protein